MSEKDKKLLNKLRVWVALRGDVELKGCYDYGVPLKCRAQAPECHCPRRGLYCASDLSEMRYEDKPGSDFTYMGKIYYCVEWVKGK